MLNLSGLEMGGYGIYVWSSYSIVAVTLIWAAISTKIKSKR